MAEPILKSSARVVSRLNFICPQLFSVSSLQPKVSLATSSISPAHEAEKVWKGLSSMTQCCHAFGIMSLTL